MRKSREGKTENECREGDSNPYGQKRPLDPESSLSTKFQHPGIRERSI